MCIKLIASIVVLSIMIIAMYQYLKPSIKEGIENSSCETDVNTLVYKNSGTIQSLEEKVEKLMDQVNKSIMTMDKNSTTINDLQTKQAKNDKLTMQAASLASDNKERLVEIAKQQDAKFKNAQNQYNKTGRVDA